MNASQTRRLQHQHVHVIRTTAERLWQALTDPGETVLYYHDLAVESDFTPGSGIRYWRRDESGARVAVVDGRVLECVPRRRLVHTFRFVDSSDPETKVAFDIEPLGEAVRLTVVHDGFVGETETYRTTQGGWARILSGLRSHLEPPAALPAPDHERS